MDKKIGYLAYNIDNDRMGILNNMDLWADDGLHCGETFEVYINDTWKSDRLELSKGEWYLVYSKLRGNELDGLKIRY